ncbi:MAG TPA: AIR synthase-related protein [Segetibacter sp.]|nr:AIR synthase-related protein [Segetibacter sp.]
MSLYAQRGVSTQKEEVHAATKHLNQGLFPNAFCKIYSDFLGNDSNWVNIMHADGAGTKSILAYLYWKETGDISVWKGIAQDAVIMNLDDLLCVGVYDNLLFSSTIDRNKQHIPGEVLEVIINGTQEVLNWLKDFGISIHYLGGETADVGDVVRTIAVNGTMTARWPKQKLVTNDKIQPGDVIVGLASSGKANYEAEYNSGIGSNGLTSARHDVLKKKYADAFPQTFEPSLPDNVVYIGGYDLKDSIKADGITTNVGKLLLSPTRTYAPVVKKLLDQHFEDIHGLVHCSGGGQTKCMKYLPVNMRIVKDDLFKPPVIFEIIQKASKSTFNEMYQVFNMGHRLEIFTTPAKANEIISIAKQFAIDAKVIGRAEKADNKELILKGSFGEIKF